MKIHYCFPLIAFIILSGYTPNFAQDRDASDALEMNDEQNEDAFSGAFRIDIPEKISHLSQDEIVEYLREMSPQEAKSLMKRSQEVSQRSLLDYDRIYDCMSYYCNSTDGQCVSLDEYIIDGWCIYLGSNLPVCAGIQMFIAVECDRVSDR